MRLSFWLYRLKWWLVGKTKIIMGSPIHIDIELASDCNLRCSMCPYGDADHPYTQRGMMPIEMARRAIDEAGALGVKSIKYQFRGEPGLNKDLESLVEYSGRWPFVDKFLNTNGLAMNAARIFRLSGLTRLILSVDGASKKTYEAIRVKANWEKLRRNFQHMVDAGLKVQVQMTRQPSNDHEAGKFLTIWPGADKVTVKRLRQTGTVRAHCSQPYRRLVVAYDGIVFGCCNNWNNEYPVGDFKAQSLKEIWSGERIKQLREHARCGTGPCENCGVGEAWKK